MNERFGYAEDLQKNLKHEEMHFEKIEYLHMHALWAMAHLREHIDN